MGIKGAMSLPFLDVVAWVGDLNARMKGPVNCIKAQVPSQFPRRVSSKSPPQYYQTSALPTEIGLVCENVEGPASLHPIRFPTFVSRPPSGETWGIIDI
jgi:hypothetical protein